MSGRQDCTAKNCATIRGCRGRKRGQQCWSRRLRPLCGPWFSHTKETWGGVWSVGDIKDVDPREDGQKIEESRHERRQKPR